MIHELIRQLVIWIYENPNWAGLALFVLSAGESMTLIGTFIPGTIVMTAVGIFIGADLLPYWPMVLWAACGTLVGDALNFTLGYVLKDNIRHVWPFKTRQHWLKKGQYFFEKHGGKSIYFARFIGPLRAFAPIIAGAMRMSPSKFYIIDTVSAFTWAISYLLPGVILGEASLELSPDISEHLFRFVFLGLIILISSVWLIKLLIVHVNEVIKNALSCLWTKIKETPSLNGLSHILHHHIKDHPRGQLGTLLVLLIILAALVFWTVCVSTQCVFISHYNDEVYHFIKSLNLSSLDTSMLIITLLGQKEILAVLFVIAIAWMCYQRCFRAAAFFTGAFVLGVLSTYALKTGIHFQRPHLMFEKIDGFSYPSGHVTVATLFYGGLAYLTASHTVMRYRWTIYTLAIAIIAAVSGSRLFLEVHWLSDIIGSILLGWLCLLIMALFYQRSNAQDIKGKKIILVILLLQTVLTVGYFKLHQQQWFNDYQLQSDDLSTNILSKQWWHSADAAIPNTITNRFGLAKGPVNIQWAALSEQDLIDGLKQNGWKSALESHNWVREILHPEESKIPTIHLNFKMRYLDDKKPALVFYKTIETSTHDFLVLQLWRTNSIIRPENKVIWAGNLSIKTDNRKIKPQESYSDMISHFTEDFGKTNNIKVLKLNQTSVILVTTTSL